MRLRTVPAYMTPVFGGEVPVVIAEGSAALIIEQGAVGDGGIVE